MAGRHRQGLPQRRRRPTAARASGSRSPRFWATTLTPSTSARTPNSAPCRGRRCPATDDGHVLLEDYTFAVVPSGPFLLEQLTRPVPADRRRRGAACRGRRPLRPRRPTRSASPGRPCRPLNTERAAVIAQARKLPKPPEVVERTGADADVAQLARRTFPGRAGRTWPRTASSPPRRARNANTCSAPMTSCLAWAVNDVGRRRATR